MKQIIKPFIYAILILPLIIYIYAFTSVKIAQTDFISFYPSAQILLKEPQNLYNYTTQLNYQQLYLDNNQIKKYKAPLLFSNPPFYLLPYIPLTKLSIELAYIVVLVTNITLLIINIYLLNKLFPPRKHKYYITLIALSIGPTFITITKSQNGLFSLLLYLVCYKYLINKQYFKTGLTSSLLTFKPQIGFIFLIYLGSRLDKRQK